MEQLTEFFANPLRLTLIAASIVILCAIIVISLKPRKTDNTPRKDYANFHTIDSLEFEETNNINVFTDEISPDGNPTEVTTNLQNPVENYTENYVEDYTEQASNTEMMSEVVKNKAKTDESFIILHVTTPTGFSIPGDALSHILGELGMIFGPHNIFHYFDQDNNAMPLFSVVNLVEPGYFDLTQPAEFTTTGVSFFMRLPLPMVEYDVSDAYSAMLHLAQKFARHIQGTVLDQDREVLSSHKIQQLRKLAEQYVAAPTPSVDEELSV